MDENVVFKKDGESSQSVDGQAPQVQPSPVSSPASLPPITPAPEAGTVQPNVPVEVPKIQNDPLGPPPSESLIPTILKVVIGIFLFLVLVFIFSRFVLPLFKGKSEKVTLTYWGLWEGENIMKTVFSDFEKENKNISVVYKKEDIRDYRDRLTTQVQNGNGPDIFLFHNTWLPMVSKLLIPLPNDIISSKDFQSIYYPSAKEDLVANGAIYGLPTGTDTLSLFINLDILKAGGVEVPKTWDEFSDVARKLTVKDEMGKIKTAGAALGTFDNVTHASDVVSLLFVQNGANIKNLSQNPQNASDALSFYASFVKDGANVWDGTLDPSVLAFAKGNLAMYFGYSWDIFTIKSINPELNFSIFDTPHLPNRNFTIASYWAQGVSIKSKHQKEALLLMKFLSKKETMQKLFTETSKTRLFGEPYARVDLADTLKDNKLVYPFVSQAPNAVSSFFASDTYDNGLNNQMNSYLGNAVRSVLGNTSPQSAVETLSAGVSQVLKQYGQ